MDVVELHDLEHQISSLLENLNRLKTDNQTLRSQLAHSANKQTELQKKNHAAAKKIRQIITQLKEELP